MFFKISVLNFTGKHPCWSLFLIKLQALESLFNKVIKKRLQNECFPVKLAKFLRTPFLTTFSVTASVHIEHNDVTCNLNR